MVSLFISGRPLWVNAELNASDAFVAVWLPGSEGSAIADVLFTQTSDEVQYDFTGKLSFSWPSSANQTKVNRFDNDYQPLLPYGFGLSYGDKNVLPDNLAATNVNNTTNLRRITLFESSIKAPWKMTIEDSDSSRVITSSISENKALYFRAIDRDVQEDARSILFSGKEKGKISFTSDYAIDITPYKNSNSTLELTVRLPKENSFSAQQKVYLSMGCGDRCQGKINISKELSLLEVDQWQTLIIDLQCFAKNGADLHNIKTPFALSTAAPLNIDFTDVYIRPNSLEQANISCQ